ncbi:hypothetical protein CDS [Bradyrhizobium sp.]|nr:hypothetical protein CDS [Bradyrhizobium sp.]
MPHDTNTPAAPLRARRNHPQDYKLDTLLYRVAFCPNLRRCQG